MKINIHRLIIDEPQTISIKSGHFPVARMRWFVSASISDGDPKRTCICSKDFVKSSFAALSGEFAEAFLSPDVTYVRCRNVVVSRVLTRAISDEPSDETRRLTAIYAGDFSLASAIYDTASGLVRAMHDDLAEKVQVLSFSLDEVAKRRRYMPQHELDRLSLELKTNRNKLARLDDALCQSGVCAKCVSPIVESHGFAPACDAKKKTFCYACAFEEPHCPACGKDDCAVKRVDDLPVYTRDDVHNNDKVDVMCRLLEARGDGDKTMVVSAYGFEALRQRMSSSLLDMSTDSLEAFSDEKKILLLDPTHFACGVNLSMTTDIVFLHKLDSKDEMQVIGRALRPPRARSMRLRVWHLRYDVEHVVIHPA